MTERNAIDARVAITFAGLRKEHAKTNAYVGTEKREENST
jgi:hypothetical protein